MKQFIVCDPVKVAGEVRKPGDILGADLMTDKLIEQMLAADLIAGYVDDGPADDDQHTSGPDTANPRPPGSVQTSPPKTQTKRTAGRKPKAT